MTVALQWDFLRQWTVSLCRAHSYATQHDDALHRLLTEARLGALVTWPGVKYKCGRAARAQDVPELAFSCEAAADRALRRPTLRSLASAYLDGNLSFPRGLLGAMPVIEAVNVANDQPQSTLERAFTLVAQTLKSVPPFRDRFESRDHYAKSGAMYELMLDRHMQYTCGVYDRPGLDLDAAQRRKFELIKDSYNNHAGALAGKFHLDIGCGWGGLLRYFTENYGTHSTGVTNSPEQRDYAVGINGADVLLGEFHLLDSRIHHYDLVTVVGMIEHLPPTRRGALLRTIHRCLAPDGLFYLQCIQKPSCWVGGDAYRLVQEIVFPGHFLETREQTIDRLSHAGFEVLWARDDGLHYSKTAAAWLQNLEAHAEECQAVLSARDFRLFTGYLALASQLFGSGRGSLGRYMVRKRLLG